MEPTTTSTAPFDSIAPVRAAGAGTPSRQAGPLAFLREATRTFRTTGAIAPSGHSLACRLAQPLAGRAYRDGRPLAVLEAGAGTGTVTRVLAEMLDRPGDRLDVVEFNPRFVRMLEGLLRTEPAMVAAGDRLRLIPESITELDLGEHRYDVIVSCLPFTNFTPETVGKILAQYLRALVPGGHLTFFAYLGTQHLRTLTAGPAEARRHRAVTALLDAFVAQHSVGRHIVWDNVPPARVHHLRTPIDHGDLCAVRVC
ncbi:class I SAM-dependent methyltransferase [Streptomyces sp. I05A-00742]|uniref:class I SAM-dependent methyltransferase n=1 Tax=Streptomyces sp. I05A-00742 TaxID=2732853 RepID=UPI00148852FB|nr:methyltransferase domain-containing protein [Streptomyces sp. I05A-00742]